MDPPGCPRLVAPRRMAGSRRRHGRCGNARARRHKSRTVAWGDELSMMGDDAGLYRPCWDCGRRTWSWCDGGTATGRCSAVAVCPAEQWELTRSTSPGSPCFCMPTPNAGVLRTVSAHHARGLRLTIFRPKEIAMGSACAIVVSPLCLCFLKLFHL